MTTAELDARIAALRNRVETLRAELSRGYIAAIEDQSQLQRAITAKAELEAIPAQIGELTRRRVLAHLAELRAEIAALMPEYERLDALDTERREAVTAWRNRRLGQTPTMLDGYAREGHALDEQYRGVSEMLERQQLQIQARYTRAANTYGVGLDGSDFERWATGRRANYPLPHTEAAWQAAAARISQEVEHKALA
jgi:uncharacterized small protein (DUF1192 family)